MFNPSFLIRVALTVFVALAAKMPGYAGEGMTEWQRAQYSEVRLLLPTEINSGGWTHAGIEIRMPAGAKTYWRTPGDTGVAPTFAFNGSTGISEPTVLFPVPEAFDDGVGGVAFGYHDQVILPVRFRATGPAKLAVQMEFGVCMKALCVPANVRLSADLPSKSARASASQILATLAMVPVPAQVGASDALAITDIKPLVQGAKLTLLVKARAKEQPSLFAEADDGFTLPKRLDNGDGYLFKTSIERGSADRPWGKARLTLAASGRGIETEIDLDALARQ